MNGVVGLCLATPSRAQVQLVVAVKEPTMARTPMAFGVIQGYP